MEDMTYAYKIMIRKPEGKRPLGRPRCKRDKNKEDLKAGFYEHGQNLRVPLNEGNFLAC
jgi:hypothetical protein